VVFNLHSIAIFGQKKRGFCKTPEAASYAIVEPSAGSNRSRSKASSFAMLHEIP